MVGSGLASKEAVPATLKQTKTMRRRQRRNRMAAKIILKTHPEARPTLGHSAKDARWAEAKVARANYGSATKAELPAAKAPRKHLTQMGSTSVPPAKDASGGPGLVPVTGKRQRTSLGISAPIAKKPREAVTRSYASARTHR
ncbi:unnamed protein product [Nezara viridula]|uniref:Uncharacterized protein n=1 Tax=Nezara viridula TaxID=85310 RepID=A0A9P0H3G1_NEZVI|nr:unnamed protein product [Nezara viridula]